MSILKYINEHLWLKKMRISAEGSDKYCVFDKIIEINRERRGEGENKNQITDIISN